MEIIINKKAVSLTDRYEIAIDGQNNYAASKRLVDFSWVIQLIEKNNDRPRMIISNASINSKYSYDITRWDNNVLAFRPNGSNYHCQCGDESYEIYADKGRTYSIFRNSIQVAFWDKKAGSWLSANHYQIIADKDCDAEILICFCIIADNFTTDERGVDRVFNIDLGNFGTGLSEFDVNWKPKT